MTKTRSVVRCAASIGRRRLKLLLLARREDGGERATLRIRGRARAPAAAALSTEMACAAARFGADGPVTIPANGPRSRSRKDPICAVPVNARAPF